MAHLYLLSLPFHEDENRHVQYEWAWICQILNPYRWGGDHIAWQQFFWLTTLCYRFSRESFFPRSGLSDQLKILLVVLSTVAERKKWRILNWELEKLLWGIFHYPIFWKNSLLKFSLNFWGLQINHEENTNVALAFSKNESINEKFCHWGKERKGKRWLSPAVLAH